MCHYSDNQLDVTALSMLNVASSIVASLSFSCKPRYPVVQIKSGGQINTDQVDTEICEQTFSWLSRYARITKHMNKQHFLFYLIYICDLHNRKRLQSQEKLTN